MIPDGERLRELASEAGLDLVGVAPVGPSQTWGAYRTWIEQGYAARMNYLARVDAIARRADPRRVLPEARSVLVVAASYAGAPHEPLPPLHGRVSRYAWGEDYHRWLLRRLKALVRSIAEVAGSFASRCYVDTGPILERDWARSAGLGWFGKNTNLIHPQLGSYLFLGVALLGLDLEPAFLPELPGCGGCIQCLESCPTGALIGPGVLDARRCRSYLTIEHRGPIPEALRPLMGEWLFGCDVCQEVCPWNRKVLRAHADDPPPPAASFYLPELLFLDAEAFRARFRTTPLWRATREGLARNTAVVLGNRGDVDAVPFLERAREEHESALVREHAGWALEQLPS